MNKLFPLTLLSLSLGLATPLSAQTAAPAAAAAPKADREKLGYSLGVDVGSTLGKQPIDFDRKAFISGVSDSLAGGKLALDENEIRTVLTNFSNSLNAKRDEVLNQRAAAGKAYLETNKTKPGVKTLPSGLQYKVLTEGKGASPKATDNVTVKYRGTLVDGTEFDNSEKHPPGTVNFPVGGVIKGWTEALQLMSPGAKWQLTIPAELAYGDNPPPGSGIAPGSTLLFDVELVSIGK